MVQNLLISFAITNLSILLGYSIYFFSKLTSFKSKSVSFGASWVRDAFDPIISENITGSSFFNHGISGATAYESFRFIQSIIANSDLINAYINIESFYDPLNGQLKKQGFDEKIEDHKDIKIKQYNLTTYYDQECISIINNIYEKDFELFNYEKTLVYF